MDEQFERNDVSQRRFCSFANASKNSQVSLPDPVAENAPGPLHMPLFVNSDELFGLHESLEIY